MNVALVFGLFPKEYQSEIIQNSKSAIQNAANALQWSFVEGFSILHDGVTVLNLPYIGSFPHRYKELNLRSKKFGIDNNIHGINIGFCNMVLYANYSRYSNLKKELKKWLSESENNRCVIIYACSWPFIKAAGSFKNKYPNIRIILIVPDLPEFFSDNLPFYKRIYASSERNKIEKTYPYVDYYVLLSKYMVDKLPVGEKPWVVVEGIYNPSDEQDVYVQAKSDDTKKILYTGTLDERYGIKNLLNAFTLIPNQNLELIICGEGNTKQYIQELALKDKRVKYLGQQKREDILKLQKQVNLLVNPRTPEGEFTKYSFPSKTIEYMASGTPVLLYKLPGIPDEYYNYCYTLEDTSAESLKNKIVEIVNTDNDLLMNKARAARNFIIENKNPIKQCSKIMDMINKNI